MLGGSPGGDTGGGEEAWGATGSSTQGVGRSAQSPQGSRGNGEEEKRKEKDQSEVHTGVCRVAAKRRGRGWHRECWYARNAHSRPRGCLCRRCVLVHMPYSLDIGK